MDRPPTDTPAPIRVLVAYWGRYGAGAKLVEQLVPALARDPRLEVHLSLSRQSELFATSRDLVPSSCHLDTFGGAVSLTYRTLTLPVQVARFARFLRARSIDAVIVVMPHIWDVALQRAASAAGVRWIVMAHDAEQHPGERARLLDWLQGVEIRNADAVVTLSRFVTERLIERRQLTPTRVTTLFHPVFDYADATGAEERPRRPLRLLFFGRILPYKGVELLLETFELLRRDQCPVVLRIAGEGAIDAPSERIAQPGLSIDQGWIAPDAIGSILNAADLLVAPYIEASQSGVIAAAYGAGLPVVTTPVGGLADQVIEEETGLVAEAIDAPSLARAIRRLVEDEALYQRCLDGVARHRATQGWDRFAAELGTLLTRTVAASG